VKRKRKKQKKNLIVNDIYVNTVFASKDNTSFCWIFTGKKHGSSYEYITIASKNKIEDWENSFMVRRHWDPDPKKGNYIYKADWKIMRQMVSVDDDFHTLWEHQIKIAYNKAAELCKV